MSTAHTSPLRRTPLHDENAALGAVFTEFGGWEMPLRYASELAEHRAVRESAGLFDLSHMGEIWVEGPGAVDLLNTALVSNFARVVVGKAKYSLMCNEQGGIVDDLIVYRLGDNRFLVVPNAGNAEAVAGQLADAATDFDVQVHDASSETSLIAVQGPLAQTILEAALTGLGADETVATRVAELGVYEACEAELCGENAIFARTGYTGEDGFEVIVSNGFAVQLWRAVVLAGEPHGVVPAGLAARDSLRLEAGMPLYGNELTTDRTPFEVGLRGVVTFAKPEAFTGRQALDAARAADPHRVLVGLRGEGRRAARSDYPVFAGDTEIGVITSGQPSPTLGYPIALALIDPAFAEIGATLSVDLRGKREPFTVVKTPFYQRKK